MDVESSTSNPLGFDVQSRRGGGGGRRRARDFTLFHRTSPALQPLVQPTSPHFTRTSAATSQYFTALHAYFSRYFTLFHRTYFTRTSAATSPYFTALHPYISSSFTPLHRTSLVLHQLLHLTSPNFTRYFTCRCPSRGGSPAPGAPHKPAYMDF